MDSLSAGSSSHPFRVLDLFCGAGGASVGLARAFRHLPSVEIVGIDLYPQPRYPFTFLLHDALSIDLSTLAPSFIWASPPCQAYSKTQKLRSNRHPDLIQRVRLLLRASGRPYCIENVLGSPLLGPALLCGAMFGLKVYRHRLFETWPFRLHPPAHPKHFIPNCKMGRKPLPGEFVHAVGHFSDVEYACQSMGLPYMTREELREAIPPAYSEFVGKTFLQQLTVNSKGLTLNASVEEEDQCQGVHGVECTGVEGGP